MFSGGPSVRTCVCPSVPCRRKQSPTALPSGHLVCNVIGFLSRCLSISNSKSPMSLPFVPRYTLNDECYLYKSRNFSADTCRNVGGTFVAADRTCYYHEYSCRSYDVGDQCHSRVACGAFSCDTCRLYSGQYERQTGW